MNKYAIGTIFGAAILSLAKKGSKTKLITSNSLRILVRSEYTLPSVFSDIFLDEEQRIIPWDWDDKQIPDGQNEEYVATIERIEQRIDEIVDNMDWTELNTLLNANKHEKYEFYMESYVDKLPKLLKLEQNLTKNYFSANNLLNTIKDYVNEEEKEKV